MVRPSGIWKYFEYVDDKIARCKTCTGTFSHSSSSTNLRKHLASKHPNIDLYQTRKYTKPIKHQTGVNRHNMAKVNMAKRKSFIWQHFRMLNNNVASCNVCSKRISYKTSISNLKKHITKRHPLVNLNEATRYDPATFPESPMQDDDNDDDEFPDDVEEVRALLGLTGAQVDKTIEIIEEVENGNHIVYRSDSYDNDRDSYQDDYDNDYNDDDDDDDYQNDSSDDDQRDYHPKVTQNNYHRHSHEDLDDDSDDLVIKRTIKPALQRCLESVQQKMKEIERQEEPPEEPEDPIDILVQNIGNQLKKMSEKQLIIAEYKIHEVLFLGASNELKYPYEEEHHNGISSHSNHNTYSMHHELLDSKHLTSL